MVSNLKELNDPGLIRLDIFGRYYPYSNVAGQLLGFTDPDNNGLSGLELQFNQELAGKNGEVILLKDAIRTVMQSPDYPRVDPIPGTDIFLTLEKDIQVIVENALKKGVREVNAKSGMAVIMDPYNGRILAMANYPGFNPNNHSRYKTLYKKNRVIKVHKPVDIVFCENGRYKIYNHYFSDTKKYGWLSFRKVVENSSNIGMIKLISDMNSKTLFKYLKNFGFGSSSHIGLIGDTDGFLTQPEKWSGLSKASISIGYEVGVNALQMTSAFAALVNGGYLYKPFIVDMIKDENGQVVFQNKSELVRQIISPEVSDILRDFMKGTVERGTGRKAKPGDFIVGGKTGTARKYNKKTGQYESKYLASFIGFAPYEQPKFVCAIFIDDPAKSLYYGGDVAAPVFADIIKQIIHFQPQNHLKERKFNRNMKFVKKVESLPEMTGFDLTSTVKFLENREYDVEIEGKGNSVKQVSLVDNKYVIKAANDHLEFNNMPDVTGLSIREALSLIDFSKIQVSISGNGIVSKQSIRVRSVSSRSKAKAGTKINGKQYLLLTCN